MQDPAPASCHFAVLSRQASKFKSGVARALQFNGGKGPDTEQATVPLERDVRATFEQEIPAR
jgi:hypothetical protein